MPKDHNFDLDKWIADLDLSPEDRTLIASKLSTDKNIKFIQESQLRQSDYTAKAQENARRANELKEKEESTDRYATSLAEWKAEQEKNLGSNSTTVAKLSGENAALKTFLQAQGIDTTGLNLDTTTTETKPTETKPDVDTNMYLTREQGIALAKWPVVFHNLNAKHQALFGKPMSEEQANQFLDATMKGGQDPNTIFDTHFKVAERKVELENQERETWKTNTRKELENQIRSDFLSQRNIPQSSLNGTAPVIEAFGLQGQKNSDRQWNNDAVAEWQARQSSREGGVQ